MAGAWRQSILPVRDIALLSDAYLSQIVAAEKFFGLLSGFVKRRKQNSYQQGDYRNNHEQFYQRESTRFQPQTKGSFRLR
jgi:hypothetical protein